LVLKETSFEARFPFLGGREDFKKAIGDQHRSGETTGESGDAIAGLVLAYKPKRKKKKRQIRKKKRIYYLP
jgi:hypothetical protein